MATEEGGLIQVVGVSGAAAEEVRVIVNGADVVRGRNEFGEAVMAGGAKANGIFAGVEDWRARRAADRAGERGVNGRFRGGKRHFES
jgi:hypothetical protein